MATRNTKSMKETPEKIETIIIMEEADGIQSAAKPAGGGTTQGTGSGGFRDIVNGGGASGHHGNGSAGLSSNGGVESPMLAPNGGGASGHHGNGSAG